MGLLESLRKRLSGRKTGDFKKSASILLGEQKLSLVDVGAAGCLPEPWEKWRGFTQVTAFEPDQKAGEVWKKRYSDSAYRLIPHGLSLAGGVQTLYKLNSPTGSSLKKLSIPLSPYLEKNYCFPIEEKEVLTKTLKQTLGEEGQSIVDGIKLDTQGTELDILKSLENSDIENIFFLETEIGCPGAYENTPHIGEWIEFMARRGFELYDLQPLRTPLAEFRKGKDLWNYLRVPNGDASVSQRIWEVDALFINKKKMKDSRLDKKQLAKACCSLCMYNFFLEALDLVDLAIEVKTISEKESETWKSAVRGIHQNLSRDTLENRFPFLAGIGEIIGGRKQRRWCQYRYYQHPNG